MKAKRNTPANASDSALIEAYIAVDAASVAVVCTDEALWDRLQKDKVRLRREMERRGMQVPYEDIREASHTARCIFFRTALHAAVTASHPPLSVEERLEGDFE